MKEVKDRVIEDGKESLSHYHDYKFDKRYEELIKQARKEKPLPETSVKKRGQNKI